MFQASKTADILEESIQVAQTKGEWELINIQSAPYTLELTDGNYSEIKYHVSTFSFHIQDYIDIMNDITVKLVKLKKPYAVLLVLLM